MKQTLWIGWREWVRLPALGDVVLRAKIDTGAKTSALHARNLRLEESGGARRARFDLRPEHPSGPRVSVSAEVIALRRIRSSNGMVELRPVIRTQITLGGRSWPVQISLTNRRDMSFEMLVGREALAGRARVDPGRSYIAEAPGP